MPFPNVLPRRMPQKNIRSSARIGHNHQSVPHMRGAILRAGFATEL